MILRSARGDTNGMKKKLVVIGTFFCSHKFHKIENNEMLKKKIWANFHKIIELFI
jgi:hypothetical protein